MFLWNDIGLKFQANVQGSERFIFQHYLSILVISYYIHPHIILTIYKVHLILSFNLHLCPLLLYKTLSNKRALWKTPLKINPNITRVDSLENYLTLSLITAFTLHYFQVIMVVWRLWWPGGQMWTWTFLTWAQRSIQPASAKSWNVPGNSWGKVSLSASLYRHAHALYEHTRTQEHTVYYKYKDINMQTHMDANTGT